MELKLYEMDPAGIYCEDTEWTRFCPEMDRWMDRQGETFNLVEAMGIITAALIAI